MINAQAVLTCMDTVWIQSLYLKEEEVVVVLGMLKHGFYYFSCFIV